MTCPNCGLEIKQLTLRCPRCTADLPLGCSGNCKECSASAKSLAVSAVGRNTSAGCTSRP